MSSIRVIAFDLDDTLIDTSGSLVPIAARRACEGMIAAGLNCSLETCLDLRKKWSVDVSHREIFRRIAQLHGSDNIENLRQIGIQEFYNPPLPDQLPLMPGALDVLHYLQHKYVLYLVTTGVPQTQERKIKATNCQHIFKHTYIVNNTIGEKKSSAFADIIKREGIQPNELLAIGNRLSQEIRFAKTIGGKTCYFAYGEHVGELPQQPEDYPDFTVHHFDEIVATCHL